MKKIIVCFIALFTGMLYSQEPLTIHDAILLGIENNIDSKIADETLNNEKLRAYTIWNTLIPNILVSASISKGEKLTNNTTTETGSMTGNLDISLSINAKTIISAYKTIADYKNGKINRIKTENLLKKEIIKSYYSLKISEDEIKIKQTTLKNAAKNYQLAEIGYKQGETSEIDKLRKEFSYRSTTEELNALENEYYNNMEDFLTLIGIKSDTHPALTDKVPDIADFDITVFDKTDIDTIHSVNTLRYEYKKAEIDRNIAIASYMPAVSLSFSPASSLNTTPSATEIVPENFTNSHTFRLSVSVPLSGILPFTQMQTDIIAGNTNIKKALLALEKERIAQNMKVKTTIKDLKYTIKAYENSKFNSMIAEKAYLLTISAYKDGSKNYTELADAEADYEKSTLSLIKLRYSFIEKYLDLKYSFINCCE